MEENLKETLLGGQSFSWNFENGVYTAVLNDRVYSVSTIEDVKNDEYLSHYFDLSFDYESAERFLLDKDPILKSAVETFGRIRILNQDPFTTLITFIISQNNNIPRIKKLYNTLSKTYGHEVEKGYYSFPNREEAQKIKEDDLCSLKFGFRAPYIIDAIEKAKVLDEIPSLNDEGSLRSLKTIKGVGNKVASCVLSFSFTRRHMFPIDVWLRRVLDKYYKGKDISFFSPYETLSQQYLFSYIRSRRDL